MANSALYITANVAAGEYAMTHNANDMGLVEGPRRFVRRSHSEPVRADAYGDSIIDGIYRGGDCFLLTTFKEYTASIKSAIWPYGTTHGDMGVTGRLDSDVSSQIILTPKTGTPAATVGKTLTFPFAILAEENDVEMLLGNNQLDIPVLFKILPFLESVSSENRWFTET